MKLQHDPLLRPAKKREIKEAWLEILQMPIQASDGNIFQFDRNSREMMQGAISAWDDAGVTSLAWRLSNNTVVTVAKDDLINYYDELVKKQGIRGFKVDQEYILYKSSSPTRRDLNGWIRSYSYESE